VTDGKGTQSCTSEVYDLPVIVEPWGNFTIVVGSQSSGSAAVADLPRLEVIVLPACNATLQASNQDVLLAGAPRVDKDHPVLELGAAVSATFISEPPSVAKWSFDLFPQTSTVQIARGPASPTTFLVRVRNPSAEHSAYHVSVRLGSGTDQHSVVLDELPAKQTWTVAALHLPGCRTGMGVQHCRSVNGKEWSWHEVAASDAAELCMETTP
jgi:hypothetical protein